MQKEISHYAYNPARNITTTYFTDGSFDTAPGDIRPEQQMAPEAGSSPQEEGTLDGLDTTVETEVDEDIELGLYRTTSEIPYIDENGTQTGVYEVGEVLEIPIELGNSWVEQGVAVAVVSQDGEEVTDENSDNYQE